MLLFGLTGVIGMGKSGIAAMLRRLRIPVYDADKTVHQIYLRPGVAQAVAAAFPEAVIAGRLNRMRLGELIFNNPARRARLTAILYPYLAAAEWRFVAAAARRRAPLVVLDIPLLFETAGQGRVDAVLVADAPVFVQHRRVLARPGMTPEKLRAILLSQWPNAEKCRLADAVIATGQSRGATLAALKKALRALRQKLASRRTKWNSMAYARNRSGYRIYGA